MEETKNNLKIIIVFQLGYSQVYKIGLVMTYIKLSFLFVVFYLNKWIDDTFESRVSLIASTRFRARLTQTIVTDSIE